MAEQVQSVRELTYYIKHRLENDPTLRGVLVEGEISNMTRHRSGHVYFSLKDQDAQISCAMWKSTAMKYLRDLPKHGEKVIVKGEVSLYPPRGSYQLIVRELRKAGVGALHQQFIQLRDRLQAEGLFDEARKSPPPRFPKRIGVLTSPTGAVIRDILDTIRRRYPHVEVLLVPTPVQGAQAAPAIARNLARMDARGVDVILLARGGGSLEDLWCFNEEVVARAIVACSTPVISGVGHETDTTIADFVADKRASTPTAAAELAVPQAADIFTYLDNSAAAFSRQLTNFIQYRRQLLDDYEDRFQQRMQGFVDQRRALLERYAEGMERHIGYLIDRQRRDLVGLEEKLERVVGDGFRERRHLLDKMEMELKSLDMRNVLQRGYSVTLKNGKMVRDASELAAGDQIETVLERGRVRSRVEAEE